MKLEIIQDPNLTDNEITVKCPRLDEDILRIITMLRVEDRKLTGELDGEIKILDPSKVLYAESLDKKIILVCENQKYKSSLRLYEFEEKLKDSDFFRVSKACVVNFRHISSIRPEIGGQLILTMADGNKIWVSRQYAGGIKAKLKAIERSFKK